MIDLTTAIVTTTTSLSMTKLSHTAYGWLSFFQALRIYRLVLVLPMASTSLVRILTCHVRLQIRANTYRSTLLNLSFSCV
jgi:hypothetical protein